MTVTGIGIHSGAPCRVNLHRAEGDVRFLRNGVEIRAHVDAVESTMLCTVLAAGGERIATVEHLLAALSVTGWWRDLVIEASGLELPILDGSAEPWLELIDALGSPPEIPHPLQVVREVQVSKGGSLVRAEPGPPELCCQIDFDHPAIGHQTWCGSPEAYAELLPARTFGFLDQAEMLKREGFALGATEENAIVFTDEGSLRPLRVPDEPVRHKGLDLLGDLFLLGRPLGARVTAVRASHTLHLDFMNELRNVSPDRSESPR